MWRVNTQRVGNIFTVTLHFTHHLPVYKVPGASGKCTWRISTVPSERDIFYGGLTFHTTVYPSIKSLGQVGVSACGGQNHTRQVGLLHGRYTDDTRYTLGSTSL